jgi:hypothetical protein
MNAVELKTQIQDFLSDNDFQACFDMLWERVGRESSTFSTLINLKGQWTDIKNAYNQNRISYDDQSRTLSRINEALSDLVNRIQNNDLKEPSSDKIATRLLIISPTRETIEEMQAFFPFEYFRETVFIYDDRYDDVEESDRLKDSIEVWINQSYENKIDENDLVIFDHFEHKRFVVDGDRRAIQLEKLEWILVYTACYIVWFGNYGDIVKQHNDRIYAANFRFALYARIREMIDYLKYYNKE